MTARNTAPAPAIASSALVDRDPKPDNLALVVEVTLRPARDPGKLDRVAAILLAMLDREVTPGKP